MTVVPGPAFSWESQCAQYAYKGEPGIHLERHSLGEYPDLWIIDCLLCRDEEGLLVGVLNYYVNNNPHEQAGNLNVFVKPQCQHQGIGSALLGEAMSRWEIDFSAQNYTFAGLRFINGLMKKGLVTL